MPSGAKKRKAARKKKERENNKINPSSTTNNYNPTQGNNDLKSIDEKGSDGGSEEVEERYPPPVRQYACDVKSLEEVTGDVKSELLLGGNEDLVVVGERDLNSEESYERKDESFEHVETAKEGNDSGTSNGESLTEKNLKDVKYNSLGEAIACHELVKSVDSSPSELNSTTKNVSVESEEARGNSAAEYSISSVKVTASESEVVVPSLEVANLALKINGDNVYPLNDENATASNFKEPKPKEYDSKVLTSSAASPLTKLTNGAEHIKNSESPEYSINQPRLSSAPNPIIVRKTAWWNCCGLIEVLSSNR